MLKLECGHSLSKCYNSFSLSFSLSLSQGKAQFKSVKDLAHDLERKEMDKKIKAAFSESDVM